MTRAYVRDNWFLCQCSIEDLRRLFERHHAYGSCSTTATYAFGVYEDGVLVAGFAWQPPPFGCASSVLPHGGVLSLSRMVAVPRGQRRLRHISNPLRMQMREIDRGRWPGLVTFSDSSLGHTGHVYKCSGWTATKISRTPNFESDGVRTSTYQNGKSSRVGLAHIGYSNKQRWEHHICAPCDAALHMERNGWVRVPIEGKLWRSGAQAMTWVRI